MSPECDDEKHTFENLIHSLISFIIKDFQTIVFIFILFPPRFSWYALWPSLGVCRTQEATWIYVGSLSFLGDNHLEVAGSILTAGE